MLPGLVGGDGGTVEELVDYLCRNLKESEFSFTLFSSAVFSYRHDSLVKPFPPMYLADGEPDISKLRNDIKRLPPLSEIADRKSTVSAQISHLILWVVKYRKTKLRYLPNSHLQQLQKLTREHNSLTPPHYLFELEYNEQSEDTFTQRSADRKIFYAYHGSNAENFYSILHHGLRGLLNKTSLFGEGTYLCIEPSVALGYSPWGHTGWTANQSQFGSSMSVIALCQIVDDPSVKHTSSNEEEKRAGVRAPNSVGGDVPDKYVVVTNDDMVRVKYLLVYSSDGGAKMAAVSETAKKRAERCSAGIRWLHSQGNFIPLVCYALVLLFIGLCNSKHFWTKMQQWYEETFDSLGWTSGFT